MRDGVLGGLGLYVCMCDVLVGGRTELEYFGNFWLVWKIPTI